MAQRQKREKTTTTETGKNQELAIPRGLACSENVAVVSRNRSNVSNSSNNGSLYLRQRTPLEKFGKKFNSRKRPGSEKYRFLIQFIEKSIDFERRGERQATLRTPSGRD